MKLSELAEALGGRLVGDGTIEVVRPVSPAAAERATDLVLAMQPDALALLAGSKARAAIVAEGTALPDGLLDGWIVIGRPRYAMAGVTAAFATPPHSFAGIHPSAVIDDSAHIGPGVSVGPLTVIGAAAEIGAGTVLMSQVTVGAAAKIGRDCLFHAGVRIGERVIVGDRVILQMNACIGADGFSYTTPGVPSFESAKWRLEEIDTRNMEIRRINSIGTVILGDDVEVGAGASIDRANIGATTIGAGTKIDDQVMVGHNCRLGRHNMLCSQVGIAGSTTIGDGVQIGGGVNIKDHLTIDAGARIAGGSQVMNNIPPHETWAGSPACEFRQAIRQYVALRQLPQLMKKVKKLIKQ